MKSKFKKILKVSFPVISFLSFVAIIISFSGVFNNTSTINIGGSSAVLPLVNTFSNVYNDADIVTSAGGSGVGINSVIQGLKEIGMASKNPGILEKPESQDYKIWKEKNIKTVTIAWDGIGVIYKPSSLNEEISMNEETLAMLYTAFSGIKKITLGQISSSSDGEGSEIELKPFARTGGSTQSGTADGFYKDSKINYKNSNYWNQLSDEEQNQVKNALEKGSYGNNVIQTAESNSQAWNNIKTSNAGPGSIVYLSSGFILNNKEEIEKEGFKIVKYGSFELTQENITNGYNWYRPFNLMFSINLIKDNKSIIDFIKWILFNEESINIIEKEGFIKLSNEQIMSMGWNGQENDEEFFVNEENADWKIGHSGATTE